jgi:hypothetical protein
MGEEDGVEEVIIIIISNNNNAGIRSKVVSKVGSNNNPMTIASVRVLGGAGGCGCLIPMSSRASQMVVVVMVDE